MTRQKSFKERIRARMEKTGESYATARRRLTEKAEAEAKKRNTPRTIARTKTSDAAVREATGRTPAEWFRLLDEWGASDKGHTAMARWLVEEHQVDGWWAQNVTVAYEQERGLRAPGQRPDGTFSVSASKTVAVAVDVLYAAFEDGGERSRWLGDYELTPRTARQSKSMTAAWEDGSTRLSIGFTAKGGAKSQVALAHERIPDARTADDLKVFWRERMEVLKKLLEG